MANEGTTGSTSADNANANAWQNDNARTIAHVLKPPKPEPYTGAMDADLCLNFVDSYEEYFQIIGLTNAKWVPFIVLALTLEARSWWRTSGLKLDTTWEDFKSAFTDRFTPPDAVNAARKRLASLTQGRRSVAEYTSDFRSCLRIIKNMDDGTSLFEYLRGLEKSTGREVRLRQPKDLKEAITQATIVHSILFPDGPPAPQPQAIHTPTSGPTPMDVDNMRIFFANMTNLFASGAPPTAVNAFSQPQSFPKRLTAEERAECMRTGSCFRCRRQGHMGPDCRAFPNKPRRMNNITNDESGKEQGQN
jgi:hypothetical protein